jgi:hypothetical protein
VQREAAVVLALADPGIVIPGRPLDELGLDSLTAVELRRRLSVRIGMPLPATVVFDHPSPNALATFLLRKMELGEQTARPTARSDADTARSVADIGRSDADVMKLFAGLRLETLERVEQACALVRLASENEASAPPESRPPDEPDLERVPDDELARIVFDLAGGTQ